MKRSIRFKMTFILISIVGSVLFITWALNNAFAERYYLAIEKNSIIHSFEDVKGYLSDDNSQEDIVEDLEQMTNQSNIKMMVAKTSDTLYTQQVVFSNLADGTRTYEQILEALQQIRTEVQDYMKQKADDSDKKQLNSWVDSNMNSELSTLATKGYYLVQMRDNFTKQNGLYLFGFTDNDYLIAMRVSIEGIRTSVRISSQFMAYMSILAILLGVIIISYYAYHFTKPIKEMAHVANHMSNLDFDSKVHTVTDDEIGELGKSINILSSTLESTIADLKSANLELQKDIEEKEEIDEMRKEFLSHVSHELKTPIAIIQGYAEGLKDGITDDKESMDFYCDVIMDEAKKMNSMVRKLLTLNQLEFGNNPLNISRFDLCEMIQNKISASQILFSDKNTEVEFNENEPLYVWADEFMIEEVFMNYLTNALNHVCDQGKIKIWFEKRDDAVRTSVYNQGTPIPQEELEKLWIKFYKVDKARTREYGGNGIGLSIVAAAMKAHNKDYGVYNVDDGVVFYFDLDTVSANHQNTSLITSDQ